MRPILAGVETEYGLFVEGRGADSQIEDAMAVVRGTPDDCFAGWDYRYESPRADLRGFKLEQLAFDPEDAKFDLGKNLPSSTDIRSDRVLTNGARFYNDHGHPEYSTPECLSLTELARHDTAGQDVVLRAAKAHQEASGREVRVYKNNTDFHGASYGTHESYLMPRSVGFERICSALTPMLLARQILVGAGKVGAEHGDPVDFQLSQRADFFVEPVNAETLYRRPIFNTRDEPHADPAAWIRVHVIAGDANMIASATARKVGLVKLALTLAEAGVAPEWILRDPVRAFKDVSRSRRGEAKIDLAKGSWTNAKEILESYFSAAEAELDLDDDLRWTIASSRELLNADEQTFARSVDWAAKRTMLQEFIDSEGLTWGDPSLRSYDLEYHNVDPDESLHQALQEMGAIEPNPDPGTLLPYQTATFEGTRAFARGLAVRKFRKHLVAATWGALSFRMEDGALEEVPLLPDRTYGPELEEAADVGTYIALLRAGL